MQFRHVSVLEKEVIAYLVPDGITPEGLFIDCTLGGGGHSQALLKQSPNARLIGIDRDLAALNSASERLAMFDFIAVHGNFADINSHLKALSIAPKSVTGILYDLGVSSHQIDTADRGFSFLQDGPLDMRMDKQQTLTAAKIIAEASEAELADIFKTYGEERHSELLAQKIVAERKVISIETTVALAKLIERVIGRWYRNEKIHPATRAFQALRIAVNGEIEMLTQALSDGIAWLKPGGRIAVITFHSLEDRIVKHLFKKLSAKCICPPEAWRCECNHVPEIKVITRRPITASSEELQTNSRARSAKLRVAEKI